MKTVLLLILLTGVGTLSCQHADSGINPKDDVELLYQRFQGRYKIISSISSEPVDIDFDGVSSNDLLEEMVVLNDADAHLELRYSPSIVKPAGPSVRFSKTTPLSKANNQSH